MKKHLFFDLDNTVSRSRSKLSPAMKEFLLNASEDIIIVSGAKCEQIDFQMDGVPCYKLGQNGNHALDPAGHTLWEEQLTSEQKTQIFDHINSMPRDWEVSDVADLVQDRGCQVSYSLLGHNENLEEKEAFDPHGEKRKNLLMKYPFIAETIQVKIGGTTCFDYTAEGKHKGHFVAKLIEYLSWEKDDAIYFGDMLFPGGNDESVIGVIDTQAVENPDDTLRHLKLQSSELVE